MITLRNIIVTLALFSVFYGVHVFSLKTLYIIFHKKLSISLKIYPFVMIILFSYVTKSSFLVSRKFYSYTVYIVTGYLGVVLNIFICSCAYRFLRKKMTINELYSKIIVLIIPTVVSIYGLINARLITTDTVTIKSNKPIKNKIKIVQVTDLHLGAIYQKRTTQKIVNKIKNEIKPDVVVITGDLFDNNSIPKYDWISPFEQIKIPILYVTGNHEELIGKNSIIDLISKAKIIHIGSCIKGYEYKDFNFIGIDYGFNVLKRLKDIKFSNNKCNIILHHVPCYRPRELKNYNFLLFLSGHTHGGQMFPLHIIDFLLNKCFRGLYQEFDKYVYVCNGVGTSLFPMRIFSHCKIGIINIE